MQTENCHDEDGRDAGGRGYFFQTVRPPSPAAPRNTGFEADPVARAFVAELWENALSGLPGIFARLVFLAGLRDAITGEYSHYGLEMPLGRAAALVIRRSHEDGFLLWISLTLEEQCRDFRRFIAASQVHRRQVLEHWSDPARYSLLVPEYAGQHERELFIADMRFITALGDACRRELALLGLLEREA